MQSLPASISELRARLRGRLHQCPRGVSGASSWPGANFLSRKGAALFSRSVQFVLEQLARAPSLADGPAALRDRGMSQRCNADAGGTSGSPAPGSCLLGQAQRAVGNHSTQARNSSPAHYRFRPREKKSVSASTPSSFKVPIDVVECQREAAMIGPWGPWNL